LRLLVGKAHTPGAALSHQFRCQGTFLNRVLIFHTLGLGDLLEAGSDCLEFPCGTEGLENEEPPIVQAEVVFPIEEEGDGRQV
jgi:hypothetical protein